jgi:CRISPR-associated endonuclease/helicase Cas3
MSNIEFDSAFAILTGHAPFPWQRKLYTEWFSVGRIPASCNLPTGLGKTSVIAIWLIALAKHPDRMPRRLVYVVNRRTVVVQTTDEIEKLRERIPDVPELDSALWRLCSIHAKGSLPQADRPIAISTLRGQFADNREWSADPTRPAVICGTVDMIGSRLLFSGYGIGFKLRPLHAGFLGQDAMLVHDEAHLEPAFQQLIEAIRDEQSREPGPLGDRMRLKVLEMTATRRGAGEAIGLTIENHQNDTVERRITAPKSLHLHENEDRPH